jgi:hypothetical protein
MVNHYSYTLAPSYPESVQELQDPVRPHSQSPLHLQLCAWSKSSIFRPSSPREEHAVELGFWEPNQIEYMGIDTEKKLGWF